jgi:branched-chain amino acid transport system permease protein
MRRFIWPSVALSACHSLSAAVHDAVPAAARRADLLYAIAASAWNIIGGYCRAVSVGHVVFFAAAPDASMAAYAHFGLRLWSDTRRHRCRGSDRRVIGVPTLRLSGIISAWRRLQLPSSRV